MAYKIILRYIRASVFLLVKKPILFFHDWLRYIEDYRKIKYMGMKKRGFRLTPSFPCLTDNISFSGYFNRYIYQDGWAFRHLLDFKPEILVDVASSSYYVAFAAQLTRVISVDIRPLKAFMPSIETRKGDITDLPFEDESVIAISSLSVIEHIGLGRYGDKIDILGMEKAANELKRVLKTEGMLLVAFPVGLENVIHFNAHRIVTPEKAFEMFDGLHLIEERYAISNKILDKEGFERLGRPYAYGCFRFTKQ